MSNLIKDFQEQLDNLIFIFGIVELSKMIEISHQTIYRWSKGETTPNLFQITQIQETLKHPCCVAVNKSFSMYFISHPKSKYQQKCKALNNV